MCKDLRVVDSISPWESPVTAKPMYKSYSAHAYRDVPVYADCNCINANRVDARIVDYKGKKASAVEMNCPWVENRGKKDEEKTAKYGFL